MAWRKSKASFANGNCVEADDWRTASYSASGACVEAASGVRVRDSKLGDASPVLHFSGVSWGRFIASLR